MGIACRSLDAAIERYVSVFGLTVVSQETNAEQGVREAMLATVVRRRPTCSCSSRSATTPRSASSSPGGARECTTSGTRCADVTAALAEIGGGGVRLIDARPRHGSMGASIAFLHPGDLGGVLTELVQPP